MRRLLPVVLVSLLLAACGTSQPPGSEPPPGQEPDPSPEPDSTTVRLTIPPEHLPLVQLVAFQNGEGSWTELEKGAGPYELEVTDSSGRYGVALRSEEHTSELQSRGHLVCRLLLEKKKTLHDGDYCLVR